MPEDSLIGCKVEDSQLSQAMLVFDLNFAFTGTRCETKPYFGDVLFTCDQCHEIVDADLGDIVQGDTVEQTDGSFKTAMQRIYAGRVIDTAWTQPEGQSARSAIIRYAICR
ncbi:hypothetical protein [Photobacterium leiognathi]|uniref:hypothetical protein n=1 Tax=Photobacterium leiognathi TaxID=553611 RepID=UPI00273322F5|nr:hypothetical protein [Photobacterium leiognathi]